MCIRTVIIANWMLFECVESVFSLEQLVGRVGLVSHATFAILYQAIGGRMMFRQNECIVSANGNELRKCEAQTR